MAVTARRQWDPDFAARVDEPLLHGRDPDLDPRHTHSLAAAPLPLPEGPATDSPPPAHAAAPAAANPNSARQIALAQAMYDELDHTGKRAHTVDQIAAEFGVTRPTI